MSPMWLAAQGGVFRTCVEIGFVVAGLVSFWVLPWLLAGWRARGARVRWQREVAARADRNGWVMLSGRLRVEGDPCQRFEDGQPAAAATAVLRARGREDLAARARAATLFLEGRQRVQLTGPIDIIAGSSEQAPKRRLRALGLLVLERVTSALPDAPLACQVRFRSVSEGDRVWVLGTRCRDPYRDRDAARAEGLVLAPARAASPARERTLVVAYGGPQRVPKRWATSLVGAAVGLLLWSLVDAVAADWATRHERYSILAFTSQWQQAPSLLLYQQLAALSDAPRVEQVLSLARLTHNLADVHRTIDALWAAGYRDQAAELIWEFPDEKYLALLYASGDRRRFEQKAERLGLAAPLTGIRLGEGRFEEASRAFEARSYDPEQFYDPAATVVPHLLAGRLDAALVELDRAGGRYFSAPCLGPALRYRSTRQPGALRELQDVVEPRPRGVAPGPSCGSHPIGHLLLADLSRGQQALDVLDGCEDCERQYPRATWLTRFRAGGCLGTTTGRARKRCHLLALTAPRVFRVSRSFDARRLTSYALSAPILAALEREGAPDAERRLVRAILAQDRAAFEGACGNIDVARRQLARAREDWSSLRDLFGTTDVRRDRDTPTGANLERLGRVVDPEARRRAALRSEIRLLLVARRSAEAEALQASAMSQCPPTEPGLGSHCAELAHLRDLARLLDSSARVTPSEARLILARELRRDVVGRGLAEALRSGDASALAGSWSPWHLALMGHYLKRHESVAVLDLSRAICENANAPAYEFSLLVHAKPSFDALRAPDSAALARGALVAHHRAWLRPETAMALLSCD